MLLNGSTMIFIMAGWNFANHHIHFVNGDAIGCNGMLTWQNFIPSPSAIDNIGLNAIFNLRVGLTFNVPLKTELSSN